MDDAPKKEVFRKNAQGVAVSAVAPDAPPPNPTLRQAFEMGWQAKLDGKKPSDDPFRGSLGGFSSEWIKGFEECDGSTLAPAAEATLEAPAEAEPAPAPLGWREGDG